MNNQNLLTIPQFARALGISVYSARKMAANREIPTISIHRRQRIHPDLVVRIQSQGIKGFMDQQEALLAS